MTDQPKAAIIRVDEIGNALVDGGNRTFAIGQRCQNEFLAFDYGKRVACRIETPDPTLEQASVECCAGGSLTDPDVRRSIGGRRLLTTDHQKRQADDRDQRVLAGPISRPGQFSPSVRHTSSKPPRLCSSMSVPAWPALNPGCSSTWGRSPKLPPNTAHSPQQPRPTDSRTVTGPARSAGR